MRPKPYKGTVAKLPLRAPPTPGELAKYGHEMMRTKRAPQGESADQALERVTQMPWASRLVDERPYQAAGWWLWRCRKESAA